MASVLGGFIQAFGGADPHLPRRNPTVESRQYLRALPQLLQAEQFYDPQISAMGQESVSRNLFGTEGGTTQKTVMGLERGRGPARNGPLVPVSRTFDVYTPASEGILSLAGRAGEGIRALDEQVSPEYSALLKSLIGAAQEDVNAGTELTPDEARQVQQYTRQGQAARGAGFGNSDVIREAVAQALRGREIREQRLGSARSTAGLYRSSTPTWMDAMRLVTGGGTQTATNDFVNPFNPYAADVANTNFGARAYEEIAQKQNRITGLNSIADGTSSLLSMFAGGGMGGVGGG